jgi:hypothetical protein
MAENLGAKLQLPLSVPTPTTRLGATIMNWFIGLCVALVTVFVYPSLKKAWQAPGHFLPWTRVQNDDGKSASGSEVGTQTTT